MQKCFLKCNRLCKTMHYERQGTPHLTTVVPFSIERIKEATVDVGNVCACFMHVGFSFN